MDLATLRSHSAVDLEDLYAREDPFDVPVGLYRGVYLARIGALRDRTIGVRLAEIVGFRWTPFWVDFSRRRWAFFTPRLGLLYDEVKPLSEDLCLGMGGVNRGPGEGELFFFALVRV
jgi:hypothetical protein